MDSCKIEANVSFCFNGDGEDDDDGVNGDDEPSSDVSFLDVSGPTRLLALKIVTRGYDKSIQEMMDSRRFSVLQLHREREEEYIPKIC